jgi:V/A-type H+-transporting ATPase subunit A
VRLVGPDVLPEQERLVLFVAELLKNAFLQQSAFDPVDMYCSPQKQMALLKVILAVYERGRSAIARGAPLAKIREMPVITDITRAKSSVANDDRTAFQEISRRLLDQFGLIERGLAQ